MFNLSFYLFIYLFTDFFWYRYIAIWHKGHFSSQESKESNLTKDIRLEAGEQMQVHRTVFKSDEVERREKERLEMLKNNTPRENLLIYSIETGELQASFFQREV